MVSPVGLCIGKPSKPWTIGKQLGSGACGSVHELTVAGASTTQWAIKIAPLPKAKAAATKGKKRKKTAEERNADLILHEYTTLQNAGEMRGRMVPELPYSGPPPYGETSDGGEFVFYYNVTCCLSPFYMVKSYFICQYYFPIHSSLIKHSCSISFPRNGTYGSSTSRSYTNPPRLA